EPAVGAGVCGGHRGGTEAGDVQPFAVAAVDGEVGGFVVPGAGADHLLEGVAAPVAAEVPASFRGEPVLVLEGFGEVEAGVEVGEDDVGVDAGGEIGDDGGVLAAGPGDVRGRVGGEERFDSAESFGVETAAGCEHTAEGVGVEPAAASTG